MASTSDQAKKSTSETRYYATPKSEAPKKAANDGQKKPVIFTDWASI